MRQRRTSLVLQLSVLISASLLEVSANFAAADQQSGVVRTLIRFALPAFVVMMVLVLGGNIVTVLLDRRAARTGDAADPGRVAPTLADRLAMAVHRQWEAEWMLRRINDPRALPVAWGPADPDLVEEWSDLAEAGASRLGVGRPGPVGWAAHPVDLSGSGDDLGDVLFSRVPTGRLVVLGNPGAGKTVLLVRLVLNLLARRQPGEPVPVLVPLASWNPGEQSLHAWLRARLATDYPWLAEPVPTGTGSPSRVQALLDQRLLLPLLDGLDEMREDVRRLAITRINDALRPGEGVVVSSRLEAYREAIRPESGPAAILRDAAGIVLYDLDPAVVAAYLRRDAGGRSAAARWDPVVAVLGTFAPVGMALRTPLMVGLARTIYNPRPEHVGALPDPPDPADLCDTDRLPTATDVERDLFDGFLPAAYRPRSDLAGGPRWRAADAERWLVHLARHLEHRLGGSIDLKWWELRASAPRPLVGAVVGTLCGLGGGLAAGLGSRVGIGFGLGLGLGIAVALAVGLPIRWLGRGTADRRNRPGVGLAGGLAGGLLGGLTAGLAGIVGIGLAPGPAGGLSAGLGVGVGAGPATGLVGGLVGSLAGGLVAGLLPGFGTGLAAGIVNGVGVGLGAGLTVGLAPRPGPARRLHWRPYGVVGGLAAGLALGFTAWRVAGLPVAVTVGLVVTLVSALVSGLIGTTEEGNEANSPQVVLARDRRAFAILALSAGVATGLVGGLVVGLSATMEKHGTVVLPALLANGLGVGLAVGLACGLTLAFVQSAWGAFAITRYWLALRGRLPWRLVSFLADAHEKRGVLRQVGTFYQFRHADLQRRLAGPAVPPQSRRATEAPDVVDVVDVVDVTS